MMYFNFDFIRRNWRQHRRKEDGDGADYDVALVDEREPRSSTTSVWGSI